MDYGAGHYPLHLTSADLDGDSDEEVVLVHEYVLILQNLTTEIASGISDDEGGRKWMLSCYPNPFGPSTTLRLEAPAAAEVIVEIFDTSGRAVKTLVHRPNSRGSINITWDGRDRSGALVPSGVYFARMVAGQRRAVRELVLIR